MKLTYIGKSTSPGNCIGRFYVRFDTADKAIRASFQPLLKFVLVTNSRT